MEATAPHILHWLETSTLALGIRQSTWAYPLANVSHVVGVVAFGAAVTVLDLVMLGVLKTHGRARVVVAVRRWTQLLLGLVFVTGAVLFLAEASHVALNRVFQVKMAIVALACVNALWLGSVGVAALTALPDTSPPPELARRTAALSLGLWLGAVALGRFIAYV
jgi:hypothetical protein